MKKWLVMFILLFMFSFSSAVSYNMGIDKTNLSAYETAKITYSINFDSSTQVDYSIKLIGEKYNETLKQESAITHLIQNTLLFSTSNIPAGEYEVVLYFTTNEGSTTYKKSISIFPTPSLFFTKNDIDVICFKNTTTTSFTVQNTGNIPLDISFSVEGNIETIVVPTTFTLPVEGEQEVNVSVVKPVSSRDFNMSFVGRHNNMEIKKQVYFHVLVPHVKMLFEADFCKENQTLLRINLSNMGNIKQNVSIKVEYFVPEGVKELVFNKEINEYTNLSFSKDIDIPEGAKILSVSATYLNSKGEEETITYNYGIFGIAIPPSLLNAFSKIWNNSTYRGIMLSALIVFAIYFIYTFYLKKKIFRKH